MEQLQQDEWRLVLRAGLFPSLGTTKLRELRTALVNRDPRLIQGNTTIPMKSHQENGPCQKACLIAFGGFLYGLSTVDEIEAYFCDVFWGIATRLKGLQSCFTLMNWWDSTNREYAESQVIQEIDQELSRREVIRSEAELLARN